MSKKSLVTIIKFGCVGINQTGKLIYDVNVYY